MCSSHAPGMWGESLGSSDESISAFPSVFLLIDLNNDFQGIARSNSVGFGMSLNLVRPMIARTQACRSQGVSSSSIYCDEPWYLQNSVLTNVSWTFLNPTVVQ